MRKAPRRGPNPERPYRPTRAELETVIRWDRDERTVHLWSADPQVWRRAARLGLVVLRESYWPGKAVAGRWYEIQAGRFRWGLKRKGGGKGDSAHFAKARVACPVPA